MSRNGLAAFNGERLQQIMKVRRQTQVQLAAMVGVSPATMSKWKNGSHSPDAKMLERMALVLNVSAEWFTRPMSREVEKPLFRSNASAYKQSREMLEGRMNWLQDVISGLEEYLDLPPVSLPVRSFTDPLEIGDEDIEIAAEEFRRLMQLGSGPIGDLLLAAESAGVVVIREYTDVKGIEGLSSWSGDGLRPLVYLSSDKDNAFRSRFDLAHELGHLILHKHIDPGKRDKDANYRLMENQAHAFAGALLLPAKSFSEKIVVPTTLDDLLIQKVYWGVSVGAMIMRLSRIGLIDDTEKANLFKRRSMRWGVKQEPKDKDRAPEKPRLLKRSIDLLLQENILTADSMVRYFGIGEQDLINMLGLEEDFFETVQRPKVIPFLKIKGKTA